jgi:hypothetical protein
VVLLPPRKAARVALVSGRIGWEWGEGRSSAAGERATMSSLDSWYFLSDNFRRIRHAISRTLTAHRGDTRHGHLVTGDIGQRRAVLDDPVLFRGSGRARLLAPVPGPQSRDGRVSAERRIFVR